MEDGEGVEEGGDAGEAKLGGVMMPRRRMDWEVIRRLARNERDEREGVLGIPAPDLKDTGFKTWNIEMRILFALCF